MKKIIIVSITAVAIVAIMICLGIFSKGNIRNAEVDIGSSEIYTEDEIQSAIDVVLKKFKSMPAVLNKIYYDEESSGQAAESLAKQYNADKVIILYTDFTTYSVALKHGLNPNSQYTYSWILTLTGNEKWQIQNFGQG